MDKKIDLVQLRYQSEAVNDMGILGLIRILNSSVRFNQHHEITGVLFFEGGHFGQILEGPRNNIEKIWEKIQNDSRHHQIIFLGISEITERRFPEWALQLFDGQEFASHLPQFANAIGHINQDDGETLHAMRSLGFQV